MMYLIAYQVRQSNGRSINDVREGIEDTIVEFGEWWRYFGDVWIIDTDMSADEMTDVLRERMHPQDDLLIAGIQPPYQGWLHPSAWEWLNKKTEERRGIAAR